jgi:protoporphyrinogen/coproporphyrinogen III oxidase
VRLIVVGGGISGLTAAYLARAAGHDVVCLEARARPGGLIASERASGFLCEAGPQAVLDDAPDTRALIAAVGLEARVVRAAEEARRRFVYLGGRLHPVPAGPPGLVRTRLLSPLGKLRLLCEPFVRAQRADPDADDDSDDSETVLAFARRRLGKQGARLVATAAIGLYAADAGRLSLRSALPRLAAMEREHGSLFRALSAARKRGRRPGHPLSFPDGLGELADALGRALGPAMVAGKATALAARAGGGWQIAVQGEGAPPTSLGGDAVVLATDAAAASHLLADVVPTAAAALDSIATAPVAVCCLGFSGGRATAGLDLGGYGFLVARGEQARLLGCQYESSIFPGRAPEGGFLLRAILGGAGPGFEPEVVAEPDDRIAARALADLRLVTGLSRDPDLVRVWRYPRGIPLPSPGHAALVASVDATLGARPGLHLLGHAVRGVGVNESIRAATALVGRLT